MQHLRDYQVEKEKYYWTTAVIFIGRDLNKALIRYLENRFVDIARQCKRYSVLTKNTYRNTVPAGIKDQRNKAKVVEGILQEDVLVSSPSGAAMFVVGKSANGLTSWKNAEGITLKDIENNEADGNC